jgi:hypothetical protein
MCHLACFHCLTVHQVQWYRSSSFALALDKYNNTAAQFQNGPPNNDTAPPSIALSDLPSDINSGFLTCLNETTGFAVPLIEADLENKLSKGELAGIIIGSIIGGILLLVILPWFIFRRYSRRKGSAIYNWRHRRNTPAVSFSTKPSVSAAQPSGGYSTYPEANGSTYAHSTTRTAVAPPESGEKPPMYGADQPMKMPEPKLS